MEKIPARLVKMGEVDADTRAALWEMGKYVPHMKPLMLVTQTKSELLSIFGTKPFSDYINMDMVPPNFEFSRLDSGAASGVLFYDKGTLQGRIYYNHEDLMEVRNSFVKSSLSILRDKYKVDAALSSHRPFPNDLVFKIDGKEKKFCGMLSNPNMNVFSFFIGLDFNIDKIRGLYKMDTAKFKARGEVKEISDVAGGLHEVCSEITEELIPEIFEKMADDMKWDLKHSSLTEQELNAIEKVRASVSTEQWKMDAKR